VATGALRSLPRGFWAACAAVFLVGWGLRLAIDSAGDQPSSSTPAAAAVDLLRAEGPPARVTATYGGLGTWVDAFDFDPAYASPGAEPPLTPEAIDELADHGVRTLYLQAARLDERADEGVLDEGLLAEFLMRAHARGMQVVGWYLPLFEDVDDDLDKLRAIAEFDALGHRFDGVAVDIEYVEAVDDPTVRSQRLVELSRRLREERPGEALGAIVPPPVQLEVVNPSYWPDFPWRALDASYDVWLPMAYWTLRAPGSGYADPYRYAEESTRRMRANVGRPDLVVHIIGGIGNETTLADLRELRRAIEDTGAIGGSIYDWNSLPADLREELSASVPS
jgi:hypothetical protein